MRMSSRRSTGSSCLLGGSREGVCPVEKGQLPLLGLESTGLKSLKQEHSMEACRKQHHIKNTPNKDFLLQNSTKLMSLQIVKFFTSIFIKNIHFSHCLCTHTDNSSILDYCKIYLSIKHIKQLQFKIFWTEQWFNCDIRF